MELEKEIIIQNAINYVKDFFDNDNKGHDYYHTMRVYKMATKIGEKEKADTFIIKLAALLHDVDDSKLVGKVTNNAYEFMKSQSLDEETIEKVMYIIENQSFRKSINANIVLKNLEAMIVQDADYLDGLGAIGIARAFAYDGSKNKQMHDPDRQITVYETEEQYTNNNSTSINHFYEKLLLLKDLINTETAKKIALERHKYMESFLEQFFAEWDGKR